MQDNPPPYAEGHYIYCGAIGRETEIGGEIGGEASEKSVENVYEEFPVVPQDLGYDVIKGSYKPQALNGHVTVYDTPRKEGIDCEYVQPLPREIENEKN